MHIDELTNRIKLRNNLNIIIHDIGTKIHDVLFYFMNKKILKVDGSITKELKNCLPNRPDNQTGVSWYIKNSHYSFSVEFSVNQQRPNNVFQDYEKEVVIFGSIENGVLKDLYRFNVNDYPIDFTLEEIQKNQKEVEEIKEKLKNAQKRLFGFPESTF